MNEKKLARGEWLVLIAAIGLGLLVRLFLLYKTNAVIDGDEAIVGLMAKHIVEGKPWPTFYYGQNYMGSFEAILAAGLFRVFGISGFALKLVPLIFSLLVIVLVYFTARRITDQFGAAVAAILVAVGPSALVLWSTMARGGFIELVVLGSIGLLFSLVFIQSTAPPRISQLLLLGLILGLGWWVNNQMMFYLVVIAAVLAVTWFSRFGGWQTLGYGFTVFVSFAIGGLPFWLYNFFGKEKFATFKELLDGPAPDHSTWFDHFRGLFSEALPILFGARRFWSDTDIIPGLSFLAYSVYVVVFALYLSRVIRSDSKSSSRSEDLLILGFVAAVVIIFSASKFGWLTKAPRYLLPLYSVLFVIVGAGVSEIRKRWGAKAGTVVFGLFLSINLISNYAFGVAVPGQPIVFRQERVATDHRELYRWLAANNYTHIWTNYWIGYRVAFETNEAVTFTRFGSPRTLRIPRYELLGREFEEFRVFVLVPGEAQLLSRTLAEMGYRFRRSVVGSYVIIDHVVPETLVQEGRLVPFTARTATSRIDWLPNIADQKVGTRWGSGVHQQPGMEIDVTLGGPIALGKIELDHGFFGSDEPRELMVEAVLDNKRSCLVFDSYGTKLAEDENPFELDEKPQIWPIYVDYSGARVTQLKLHQMGYDPIFDWSLAELRLYWQAD